ncbi:MAG TPA: ATP phosphoribosyltransferase [Planctomycetota bacterium]|nr:ATP phosphoribosyltransferase [Planctomycetota bacterium]
MLLKIGLPKGSLQESTFELMRRAGFSLEVGSRSYFPSIDDEEIEVVLFRAQEMSRYVEQGVIDLGLTGKDWIEENGSDVYEVEELLYNKQTLHAAKWVLAVPEASPATCVKDLQGKLIATELVSVTKRFLEKNNVTARVEYSYGATEAKVGIVDAIVELTETGSSLRSNRLKVIETLMLTTPRLIANRQSWQDACKREKIENITMLLKGAIMARMKVGLKMNVPQNAKDEVLALLPALKMPTLSPLSVDGWFAVETVLDETSARKIIPELKRAGAQGIIEYPLNKVIP